MNFSFMKNSFVNSFKNRFQILIKLITKTIQHAQFTN